MGKVKLLLVVQMFLLLQIVGTMKSDIDLQKTTIPNQDITLNQQFSESDFFFSKLFLERSSDKDPIEDDIIPPNNSGLGIDTDSENNIIMVGKVNEDSYPVINGFNGTFGGREEGFVTKLSENGDIIWSTFLGGSGTDVATSVVIDSQDNVIVSGFTESSDFPNTVGAYQETIGGSRDMFITKFDPQGEMLWSTFIGGEKREGFFESFGGGSNKIAVDSQDYIVLSGSTASPNLVMNNAFQSSFGGGTTDVFLAKFNSSGKLEWSTFFGGDDEERSNDVAIDTENNIVIVGTTASSGFPVINPHDGIRSGTAENIDHSDTFVSKFNSTGSLLWSTFQGGDQLFNDQQSGLNENAGKTVSIDSNDNIIVGGTTTIRNNEVTPDAFNLNGEGYEGGFISKYDSNGSLYYGSYFGKDGRNFIMDSYLDEKDNLYLTIGSNDVALDRPILHNYFHYQKLTLGNGQVPDLTANDPLMVKFNSSNGLLWSTDYLSPNIYEGSYAMTIDNLGRIVTTGYTYSADLPGETENWNLEEGSSPYLHIIKLDPLGDEDEDELLNFEEFQSKSVPSNSDTDGDGLSDGVEVHEHGTNPNNVDSDADGLSDFYELERGYSPTSNDTDNDLMLDGWEDLYNLDPTDARDIDTDIDDDGLDALGEFQAGTNPKVADTDGDGMKDGYEVDHNLNPLKDDANNDKDGDLLPNKFEHDYGMNPDSPIETIVAGLILIISLSAITYYILRARRLNAIAIKEGYKHRSEKKLTLERGFSSIKDLKNAEVLGFKTKLAMTMVQSSKVQTVSEMAQSWESQSTSISEIMTSFDLIQITEVANTTTSPIDLHDAELSYEHSIGEMKDLEIDLKSMLSLQESIVDLPKVDIDLPLVGLSIDDLHIHRSKTKDQLEGVTAIISKFEKLINERKIWFEPWQPMLTLIQMTQDGLPIDLARIAEVIRCPEDQAEKLLKLLLAENSLIGLYDASKKLYTKGTNISQYIESMLAKMSSFGE
ncbi:MAG: hypothetical protein GPJ54_19595 [Candidatus Heimdallarchaeota archaeon]|nr:hypothetical protein [Candidatus Heimdallarchaeota archaeon]